MVSSTEAADKYPRTGKRGVPQQFPRKVFDMLETESGGAGSVIVHWSPSGRSFRIADSARFSSETLPRYFKTSKLSSFQRNLNLYGFTKIRKGPEIDSYYHPSGCFTRSSPSLLSQLRKRAKAPRKKNQASMPPATSPISSPVGFSLGYQQSIRVISPTTSTCSSTNDFYNHNASNTQAEAQRKQERLSMLADAMVLMIGEE